MCLNWRLRKLVLRIHALLLALIFSNTINAFAIYGSDVFDVTGNEGSLSGYGDSTINVHPGSSVAWLYGYEASTINIYGGDISWLTLYDQSVANITGVEDLSWLLVNDNSKVNIFGSDFSYSHGHLSGVWQDGSSFSFWALREIDVSYVNITDILPDNIKLHVVSVPEPGTVLLFLIGLVLVFHVSRTRGGCRGYA